MKAKVLLLSLITLILSSCRSSIKPEMVDLMEAVLNQSVRETLLERADYGYSDFELELTEVTEKQYEFKGDKYGTYQGEFKYSFEDGQKSVKVMGVAVFSYDCSLSVVYGCPGIFVDAIFVNGKGRSLEDSEYYFNQCDWE